LSQEEIFHVGIVGLTEELKESEGPAQGELKIELSLDLKFVTAVMSKLFGEGFLLDIKMIVRVNRFICKISDFFVVFHFSDLDKEVSDEINSVFDTDEHKVIRICS
jgi:hypothetical protein